MKKKTFIFFSIVILAFICITGFSAIKSPESVQQYNQVTQHLNPQDNPASEKERNDVKRDIINGNTQNAVPIN